MDFSDTEREATFRAEARRWLEGEAEPLAAGESRPTLYDWRRRPRALEQAKEWMLRKAQARWACLTWPKEFGGRAASRIEQAIWDQEEARFRTPPNMFTIGQGMLGPAIMEHGTAAQRERYLGPILQGAEVWCQLFSEPAAGSDLAGLNTRATREGDDWIIEGQKIWTSGAQYCDFGMLLARTSPENPKHHGITYFIVDMRTAGIEVRPIRQMNGTSGFNEVFFSQVRVPDRNRVGPVDEGWRGALTTLMHERQTLSGGASGPGFAEVFALARESRWRGRSALRDAYVRDSLADMHIRLKGIEYARYRSLSALSRGAAPGAESSIGKLVGAQLRQQIASFALELLGPGASSLSVEDSPLGALFADAYLAAPGARIAGGTDEVLRNIVAERILGLPPEPRLDKKIPYSEIPTGRVLD